MTIPVKENEGTGTLIMRGPDGKEISLSDLPVLNSKIDRDEELQNVIVTFPNHVTLDFSMVSIMPPRELCILLHGLCTQEQLKQNNWRRLHGLPMKRRN